jgi:hypothetical protein
MEEFEVSPALTERAMRVFTYKEAIDHLFRRFVEETVNNRREIKKVWQEIYAELKARGREVDNATELCQFNHRNNKITITKKVSSSTKALPSQ